MFVKLYYHQYTRPNVKPPSWKLASGGPIIEMLMNCIFNQINGAFHSYLSLYISDNNNDMTFVEYITTRATLSKQYALHQKSCYCLIKVIICFYIYICSAIVYIVVKTTNLNWLFQIHINLFKYPNILVKVTGFWDF